MDIVGRYLPGERPVITFRKKDNPPVSEGDTITVFGLEFCVEKMECTGGRCTAIVSERRECGSGRAKLEYPGRYRDDTYSVYLPADILNGMLAS